MSANEAGGGRFHLIGCGVLRVQPGSAESCGVAACQDGRAVLSGTQEITGGRMVMSDSLDGKIIDTPEGPMTWAEWKKKNPVQLPSRRTKGKNLPKKVKRLTSEG